MTEVGVAFLSGILGVVFHKMASPRVVDFICRRKSTDALLKKLEIALLPMNMVLEDAEDKQFTNPNVKKWIDELKDVAYDAEDILDEIATEALRCELDAEFQSAAGKFLKCRGSILTRSFAATLLRKRWIVDDPFWKGQPQHQKRVEHEAWGAWLWRRLILKAATWEKAA